MSPAPHEKGETQLVVFALSSEEYALDVSSVREIIRLDRITRVPRAPPWVDGVINLRGLVTTVVDLRRRLGLPISPPDGNTRIMIVEHKDTVAGLVVDSVLEVLRPNADELSEAPGLLAKGQLTSFVRGIARLGNRILILLDLEKVLDFEVAPEVVEAVN